MLSVKKFLLVNKVRIDEAQNIVALFKDHM